MSYLIARSLGSAAMLEKDYLRDQLGEKLGIKDHLPAGFPYLVDQRTMEPDYHVLKYLLFASANGTLSLNSAKNRTDHLYELFLYIEGIGLDWRAVRLPEIELYRDRLASYVSPLTRRHLVPGTIAARIGTALAFYAYAEHKKWIPQGSIPASPPVPSKGNGSHPRRAQPTLVPLAPTRTTLIEFVNDVDLRRLMGALGGPPSSCDRSRDWLVSLVCVTTALRIAEALGLTVPQVQEFGLRLAEDERAKLLVFEGVKGGQPRDIAVPGTVIDHLQAYIDGERAEAIKAGLKSGSIRRDPGSLFVNGLDCPPQWIGQPYKKKRAEEAFAAAQLSAGICRKEVLYDPETKEAIGFRDRSKHVIHHLRHTWAIHEWHALAPLPAEDRWIRLQHQLGHKTHRVTADTYLRAVTSCTTEARDIYTGVLKVLAEAHA